MSSPVRQMTHRRLPPLPGVAPHRRQGRRSPVNDMVITGVTCSPGLISHHSSRSTHSSSTMYPRTPDLQTETVTQFLFDNPDFLDSFVIQHVHEDRVRQWSQRKHKGQGHNALTLTNGDLFKDHRSNWKNCIQSKKWRVLQELTKDNTTNKARVFTELAACAAESVNADGHNLYLVDDQNQLFLASKSSKNQRAPTTCVGRIEPRTTLPAYVAYTKESVVTQNLVGDPRFPLGFGVETEKGVSAIAVPLLHGSNTILGVVELYRNYGNMPFSVEEEEVAEMMLVWADICMEYVEIVVNIILWGGFAVYYMEMYNSMMKQRKLNDFLLAVTKSIFQDIVSMDTVIMKIMNYAKKLVIADRASLFLVDTKSRELYARIFDTGRVEEHIPQKEIRFPMDRGVAGHVASTGEVLNIADAYTDSRFNRDVDLQTGYRTKSILCMPIYNRGNIIGVVQMVNKIDGVFTKGDEESFETFAIYCGLALHHAKLYDKIRRSEQKYRVAVEVLSYHSQCNDEEYQMIKTMPIPDDIPDILDYDYSPWAIDNDNKPVYVLYMMRDIFKMHSQFDIDDMIRFTLTVRKNYRNVPYHNWAHAFSVAHAMFAVIKTSQHHFTPIESLALYIACLCHDLDHRGKTNAFMVKSAAPLAAIYSTSTMEHHHFNHTVTILQNEGHNIFKHLTSAEYKQILSDIRHCILATDLALFFGNRSRLQDIADKGEFSWDNAEHRRLVMANSMTAADLCSMYKPWDLQVQLVDVIMEEFWQQGDEERSQGLTPMPMMDRQKKNELPHLEVGFLVGICLPCYEVMAQILPETKPMVNGAIANLKKWRELAEKEAMEKEKENQEPQKPQQTDDNQDNEIEKQPMISEKPSDDAKVTSEKTLLSTGDGLDDSASDTSFLAADKPLPDISSDQTSNISVSSEKTALSLHSEESR
ncbi:probable 3',5'-cyclic phosphodiesterase pde-5 isoform X5 [Saccostrea echinata]|uniref:probable 3',5'-cyclic phosphodiesterase pde-5 isoform X5 n=1 Tax=Saccostrea echinata TaxID=191078 RepID=UPI002A80DE79|nr:probable 3',5'-cyclic phosphodiesterase pde-5 isoform X5 [Saccostrea echinata]